MPMTEKVLVHGMLDALIRAGLIAALVIFCFQVFHPFLNLMLWSLILAITLYPLQLWLKARVGQRDGHAATLIVVIAIGILLVPVLMLGVSTSDSVEIAIEAVRKHGVQIKPPADSVLTWPLIGKAVHGYWLQAATDPGSLAQALAPKLRDVSLDLLSKLAGLGMGLMLFFVALMIAGIFLAFGESGERSAVQILTRISGPEKGPKLATLCTRTVRAVAQGGVGIAFIQMVLVGLGFAVKGVPGAGILALAVLLLGIMQLPATLITLPVIGYVMATEGVNTTTIIFAIFVFLAGLVDNVLKPLLLGRGVAVPMPVILIGALGGMVTNGIIGLFIGPVVLAVGYELFWAWVRDQPETVATVTAAEPADVA